MMFSVFIYRANPGFCRHEKQINQINHPTGGLQLIEHNVYKILVVSIVLHHHLSFITILVRWLMQSIRKVAFVLFHR